MTPSGCCLIPSVLTDSSPQRGGCGPLLGGWVGRVKDRLWGQLVPRLRPQPVPPGMGGKRSGTNWAPITSRQLSSGRGAAEKGRNPHRARVDPSSRLLSAWSSAAELSLSRNVHKHCSMFGAGRGARCSGHGEINRDPHDTEHGEM